MGSTLTPQIERALGTENYRGTPEAAEATLQQMLLRQQEVSLPLAVMASGQLEFKLGARLDRAFPGVSRATRCRRQQNAVILFTQTDLMLARTEEDVTQWQGVNRWYWFMAALLSPTKYYTKQQLHDLVNAIGEFSEPAPA